MSAADGRSWKALGAVVALLKLGALQAGGSPTFTLTEDFALGMEMKKLKWHCRYVQAYLALGEAPEQIRNCFQQRSRWCKVGPALPATLQGRWLCLCAAGASLCWSALQGADQQICSLR